MSAIHLLARRNDQPPGSFFQVRDGVHFTGWWALSEDAARRLVGGSVFLHQTKATPSWYGGTILGYRVGQEGPRGENRIGFEFQFAQVARNVAWDWGDHAPNVRAEMSIVFP
jgi:hypothetical protein